MEINKMKAVKMILNSGVIVTKDNKEKHTTIKNMLKKYISIHNSLCCLENSEYILDNYIVNKRVNDFGDDNEIKELYEQLYNLLFDEFYDLELGLVDLLSTFIIYGNEDMKKVILPYNRKFISKTKDNFIYEIVIFALQDFLESCKVSDTMNNKKLLQHFIGIFAVINMRLDEIRENAEK